MSGVEDTIIDNIGIKYGEIALSRVPYMIAVLVLASLSALASTEICDISSLILMASENFAHFTSSFVSSKISRCRFF